MSFPFSNSTTVTIPIHLSDKLFPVNQIYCVGRNYVSHAIEMGFIGKESPFFFSKPNWTIATGDIEYPQSTKDLQHEVELVLAIGEENSVFGFGIGVDLTRRDLQGQAKKEGKPWFKGKSFIGSSPISKIVPIAQSFDFSRLNLQLMVNGKLRQSGSCSDMIWSPKEIVVALESDVPLLPGDLIFTGTPEGVGSLFIGDRVVATIPDNIELSFCVR